MIDSGAQQQQQQQQQQQRIRQRLAAADTVCRQNRYRIFCVVLVYLYSLDISSKIASCSVSDILQQSLSHPVNDVVDRLGKLSGAFQKGLAKTSRVLRKGVNAIKQLVEEDPQPLRPIPRASRQTAPAGKQRKPLPPNSHQSRTTPPPAVSQIMTPDLLSMDQPSPPTQTPYTAPPTLANTSFRLSSHALDLLVPYEDQTQTSTPSSATIETDLLDMSGQGEADLLQDITASPTTTISTFSEDSIKPQRKSVNILDFDPYHRSTSGSIPSSTSRLEDILAPSPSTEPKQSQMSSEEIQQHNRPITKINLVSDLRGSRSEQLENDLLFF